MLQSRFKAEIVTPASAQAERMVLDAKAEAVRMTSKAQAELDQLAITLETLSKAGPGARKAWLIDNFDRLFAPFAETLSSLPAERITVLTGSPMGDEPLSAIHPNAAAMARNELIAGALAGQAAAPAAAQQASGPAAQQGGQGKPRT